MIQTADVVSMLEEYYQLDPKCLKTFKKLAGQEICFDWSEPLLKIYDENH